MKQHPWEKYIIKIEPKFQDSELNLGSQIVYDPDDKCLRLDLWANSNKDSTHKIHQHMPLNRKQAVKMLGLIEEFLKWNIK